MKITSVNRSFVALVAVVCLLSGCADKELTEVRYLASATTTAELYSMDEEGVLSVAGHFLRGTEVVAYPNCTERVEKVSYVKLLVD